MITAKTLRVIEYDKIMSKVSEYAVLGKTKEFLSNFCPETVFDNVKTILAKTQEAFSLLYEFDCGEIYYFDDIENELVRANAGGTLNNGELLKIASNLTGARLLRNSITNVKDEKIVLLGEIASRIYTNSEFEKEITDKIISQDEISDNASPKLYLIRKTIRDLNAKIRDRLNSYIHGSLGKYLQDNVVTIRQDRYVIPVKSEYRSFVKGFIHDQSSTGSTVFIEPEQVMELNNDLKRATFDEAEEVHRILAELSYKVTFMADALKFNAENISEIDSYYARAIYSFKNKCVMPRINDKGIVRIFQGRHPLIDREKVVPITLNFGNAYHYLIISGPNTGGKTVTLKLTGLLTLMAMSGVFVPANDGTEISVFESVFCDIGDEQSIENDLSTFSSHIKNIKEIIDNSNEKSLILIDEIGAGTDPDEGSALALAVIKNLIKKKSFGIITTHYSRLKEYATENELIENASMEFDSKTLKPLYKLNIGIPGSSNAIDIAKILGIDSSVIEESLTYLSNKQISFENVLKKAEESRREAERVKDELEKIKLVSAQKLELINQEKDRVTAEREKIYLNAKAETKRIVADKLEEAEEIIDELKKILRRVGLESKEIFKAGELKNKLKNSKYLQFDENMPFELNEVTEEQLKIGNKVFVKSLNCYGKLVAIKQNKKEAEVLIGTIKSIVKTSDIFNSQEDLSNKKEVRVFRKVGGIVEKNEVNVVGENSLEAIEHVKDFIDKAIVCNLEEIKIVHGYGEGVLVKKIREYLKTDKNVDSFRRGNYGEGENGVTIVKLK